MPPPHPNHFTAVDLLQAVAQGRSTGKLQVSGPVTGTIWFRNGVVVHAETPEAAGLNALHQILSA